MQPQNFPQNVPRLFDLITPAEERFKPAFYHYMKDTLVANDINQAREVAYGARRFRVVDLVGNLIEMTSRRGALGPRAPQTSDGRSATTHRGTTPEH